MFYGKFRQTAFRHSPTGCMILLNSGIKITTGRESRMRSRDRRSRLASSTPSWLLQPLPFAFPPPTRWSSGLGFLVVSGHSPIRHSGYLHRHLSASWKSRLRFLQERNSWAKNVSVKINCSEDFCDGRPETAVGIAIKLHIPSIDESDMTWCWFSAKIFLFMMVNMSDKLLREYSSICQKIANKPFHSYLLRIFSRVLAVAHNQRTISPHPDGLNRCRFDRAGFDMYRGKGRDCREREISCAQGVA